jgi:choline dehydrogenase-like flavoprotein
MSDIVAHYPVIIVGGGAAGAAAALGFGGTVPLMLDAGATAVPSPLPSRPVAELLAAATSPEDIRELDRVLIGDEFQSILRPQERDLSIKLKAPFVRFITDRPPCLPADEHHGCTTTQSFAVGGLANAWGAGAMRYTRAELRYFPFPAPDIEAAFDALTRHIGISGSATDDLTEYFGSTDGLLPELDLCELGARFMDRYERNKSRFTSRGLRVGRPRLAVLPINHRGREPFRAFGQEFFVSPHDGIYTPSFTIQELVHRRQLEYRSGLLIERFECAAERVVVHARDMATSETLRYSSDHLILAAGTLNTTRIVLASRNDHSSRLPLLDNPVTLLPFVDLGRIGHPLEPTTFLGAELALVLDSSWTAMPVQGSIYNLMGPLRADLAREFPLSFSGNLAAARYLAPATLMLQLFFPDEPGPSNHVQLQPSGGLRVVRTAVRCPHVERTVIRALRAIGYAASTLLARHPPPGSSIHYAGTIPAREQPVREFETDRDCRLPWAQRVTIADASTFPILPAKNHTLMIMANALRIGQLVQRRIAAHC